MFRLLTVGHLQGASFSICSLCLNLYVRNSTKHRISDSGRKSETNFPPIIVINSQPPIQEHYIIGRSGLQQEITVLLYIAPSAYDSPKYTRIRRY